MFVRRTNCTFSILVATLAALAAAPCVLSPESGLAPALAQESSQPMAAARAGALRLTRAPATCGSDERKKARREAADARREASKAKREEAAAKRGEAAQARREAADARREASKAKREQASSGAQDRREAAEARREASKAKREEAHAAAKAKREEAHAAALASREERTSKLQEAKQRREEAAEERRERVASASESKHARKGNDEPDDDVDSDVSPTATGGFGTLRVNSRPWAQVYVDGKLVGHTPQLGLNVPAGEHNVRLVNGTFAMSKTFRLNVRQGERVTRVETLEE